VASLSPVKAQLTLILKMFVLGVALEIRCAIISMKVMIFETLVEYYE
jgi:hypothetical protein